MNEGGRIINISSTITAMMLPTYSAYVATKRAVEQVTRVLAKEVGNRGITVNVVSPGLTDTPLFREGIVIPINFRSASKMLALQIMCFLRRNDYSKTQHPLCRCWVLLQYSN